MMYVIFSFILFFFSCSNDSGSTYSDTPENNSIRSSVEQTKNSIQWVDESKGGSEENAQIENNTWEPTSRITIENGEIAPLFFQHLNADVALYPYLDGFASLDTSSVPNHLYQFILDFLDSLNTKNIDASFFNEEQLYLKTIIQYEMREYPVIVSHVIGEAFLFDNPSGAYEIPIRLVFENGYANCFLYCELDGDTYKVEQFDIGAVKNE